MRHLSTRFACVLAHERRRIVHIAVTDHPTAAWTAQRLREAFSWDEAPKYLIHDRDTAVHGTIVTIPHLDGVHH